MGSEAGARIIEKKYSLYLLDIYKDFVQAQELMFWVSVVNKNTQCNTQELFRRFLCKVSDFAMTGSGIVWTDVKYSTYLCRVSILYSANNVTYFK